MWCSHHQSKITNHTTLSGINLLLPQINNNKKCHPHVVQWILYWIFFLNSKTVVLQSLVVAEVTSSIHLKIQTSRTMRGCVRVFNMQRSIYENIECSGNGGNSRKNIQCPLWSQEATSPVWSCLLQDLIIRGVVIIRYLGFPCVGRASGRTMYSTPLAREFDK